MNKSLNQLFSELQEIIKANSQVLNGQVWVRLDTPLEMKLLDIEEELEMEPL